MGFYSNESSAAGWLRDTTTDQKNFLAAITKNTKMTASCSCCTLSVSAKDKKWFSSWWSSLGGLHAFSSAHILPNIFPIFPNLYVDQAGLLGQIWEVKSWSSHLALYNVQSEHDYAIFVHSSFRSWTILLLSSATMKWKILVLFAIFWGFRLQIVLEIISSLRECTMRILLLGLTWQILIYPTSIELHLKLSPDDGEPLLNPTCYL